MLGKLGNCVLPVGKTSRNERLLQATDRMQIHRYNRRLGLGLRRSEAKTNQTIAFGMNPLLLTSFQIHVEESEMKMVGGPCHRLLALAAGWPSISPVCVLTFPR